VTVTKFAGVVAEMRPQDGDELLAGMFHTLLAAYWDGRVAVPPGTTSMATSE
jgi:hypothetical protein